MIILKLQQGEIVMNKVYDFLTECGVYYLLTLNSDSPAGRPFGIIMENEDKIYFATGHGKDVYNQMIDNPNIQIVALKNGTRDWIRINGKAIECKDISIKKIMLDKYPRLTQHYDSPECEVFALFEMAEINGHLYTNAGIEAVNV